MRSLFVTSLFFVVAITSAQSKVATTSSYPPAATVAANFKKMLQRPVAGFKPSFQTIVTDTVIIEKGFIYTEETEKIPVVIYKPIKAGIKSFPVVICLHGTGGSKDDESIKSLLYQFSRLGMMGVAIDARYHGERIQGGAEKSVQYVEAIAKAFHAGSQKHPFYYDTVYDLWRLTDYLVTRPDVEANRIGMMGISMGGIETWMAASVDNRIKVAVPVIAAQSFKCSLETNNWQGRARTIWKVHEQAAHEMGDTIVTKENVNMVWKKLVPGITGEFDCPSMIRLFAPRPLLLLNNEMDQNCPLPGAKIAFKAATETYRSKKALDKLKIHVTPNEPHRFLPAHADMTIAWFKRWL